MRDQIALIVGGSNGIGLSIGQQLLNQGYSKIYIADKSEPDIFLSDRIEFHRFNLLNEDFSIFNQFSNINTLIVTSGFGRVAPFSELSDIEIINNLKVNALAVFRIIRTFYDRLSSSDAFYCTVMGSVAGLVSSPLFSIYGASKAAVCKFVESINVELEKNGSPNRILNVAPGSIQGTRFNGGSNDLQQTEVLAQEIIAKMFQREKLFIPQYEEVFKRVLNDYHADAHQFGLKSFDYKINNGRTSSKRQVKTGYLSGTFDLFHIGHLNLLRRAKEYCDYLVVGIHKDAAHKGKETFIPLEERIEIVKSIHYVDQVILSKPEDMDVWLDINYDYLFVGSDYKNTERFNRYEKYFQEKNVEIVYFPYTQDTSSTQLRMALSKN